MDQFIPFDDAMKAADAWIEIEKMQKGKKYSEEKAIQLQILVKKYFDSDTLEQFNEKFSQE